MKRVTILAVGGTVAGSGPGSLDASYTSGTVTVDKLIAAVPEINKIATIKGEQISNIGSQEMNNEVWFKLANRVNELLTSDEADGVVITHGTDTMEETAYFLNLVVKSDKPIVFTGAMRNSGSLSADGPLNIYNAVNVAMSKEAVGKGVMVVMNDEIHAAREVTKSDTTAVDTFKSPNSGKIGTVYYGRVNFNQNFARGVHGGAKFNLLNFADEISGVKLPKVEIIYLYAGCADFALECVRTAVECGARGVVFAGLGNGNLPSNLLKNLSPFQAKGIIFVRSTRVFCGEVSPCGEIDDFETGLVSSADLNPQKARILLMLSLFARLNLNEIREIFC